MVGSPEQVLEVDVIAEVSDVSEACEVFGGCESCFGLLSAVSKISWRLRLDYLVIFLLQDLAVLQERQVLSVWSLGVVAAVLLSSKLVVELRDEQLLLRLICSCLILVHLLAQLECSCELVLRSECIASLGSRGRAELY